MPAWVKTDGPPPVGCAPGGTLGGFFWVSGPSQIQGLRARVKRADLVWWVGGGGGGAGGDGSARGWRCRRRALVCFLGASRYAVWPEEAAPRSLNAEEIVAGPWPWFRATVSGAVWYPLPWISLDLTIRRR